VIERAVSNDELLAIISKAEGAFSNGRMATARLAAAQAVTSLAQAPTELKLRAYVIMGKVELASEQFAEAERTFSRALAIDPDNPLARKGKQRAQEAARAERR
jgi:Flp pilus assembly protein TadD